MIHQPEQLSCACAVRVGSGKEGGWGKDRRREPEKRSKVAEREALGQTC